MASKEQFEDAAQRVQNLPERPDNDVLLQLYALYKQATEGDVHGDRPGMMDFAGKAKYNAWEDLKGKAKDDAMAEYVALVEKLEASA